MEDPADPMIVDTGLRLDHREFERLALVFCAKVGPLESFLVPTEGMTGKPKETMQCGYCGNKEGIIPLHEWLDMRGIDEDHNKIGLDLAKLLAALLADSDVPFRREMKSRRAA
jgi:hypothetical protein